MCDCKRKFKCDCVPIYPSVTPMIWILGGPGSGKGTQCERIVEKYGFTHLSTGDLLRAEVESGSERGKELTEIMKRGELVSNATVMELLKEAIWKVVKKSRGYLIDGYPREKEQGIMFEELITPVDLVLFFDAPEDVLVKRLLKRAKSSRRADDNLETIKLRLQTFNTNNNLVIEQYASKLKKIDATRNVDVIFNEVEAHLDALVALKSPYH